MSVATKNYRECYWFATLISGLVIGTLALAFVLTYGHTHEFNAPLEPPWGILVATYEIFIFTSAGLGLLYGLGRASGFWLTEELGQKALIAAMLALPVALAPVLIELTHPMRLNLNVAATSTFWVAIFDAGIIYLCFFVWLGSSFWFASRRPSWLAGFLGLAAFATALAGLYRMGAAMGILDIGASWHEGWFPLRVAISGMVLGGALLPQIFAIGQLFRGNTAAKARPVFAALGRLLLLLLALHLLYLIAEITMGILNPNGARYQQAIALVSGPLAINFWLFEVLGGLFLPLLLLLYGPRHRPIAVLLASALALLGQFAMHFDRMIAAQLTRLAGNVSMFDSGLFSYLPCLPKASVAWGAVTLFLLLYSLFERLLSPASST